MATIKVSAEIHKAFESLKAELYKIYPAKKISDDEIMWAMIGWFFDSLAHMQQHSHAGHHHDDHECCGSWACKDDGKCKCE